MADTKKTIGVVCGDFNTSIDVEVTVEGIVVDYELVTWEWINAARAEVQPKTPDGRGIQPAD